MMMMGMLVGLKLKLIGNVVASVLCFLVQMRIYFYYLDIILCCTKFFNYYILDYDKI